MTERIRDFLRNRRDDRPCLVVDLEVVRDNYRTFAQALPDSRPERDSQDPIFPRVATVVAPNT